MTDSLVVDVRDADGKPVSGTAVTWRVASGGGSVTPAGATTDAAGRAKAAWTLGPTAGQQKVTATVTGLTPAEFVALGTPGAATRIEVLAGSNQQGDAGAPLSDSVAVVAHDEHGNTVPGVLVSWSVIEGAGSANPSSSTTNALGQAKTAWTLGAGERNHRLAATAGGLPPVEFTALGVVPALFSTLAPGFEHACGLSVEGLASCWGTNLWGELGSGSKGGQQNTPVRVQGDLVFTDLAAGAGHTCGLSGGVAYCWGLNMNGQLGDGGEAAYAAAPVRVSGSRHFTAISAGMQHSCGLTAGGEAYCWGRDQADPNAAVRTPVLRSGSLALAAISVGGAHSCGLTEDGQAFCWGAGDDGRLGNGTTGGHASSPVPVSGGHRFTSLSSGMGHTCGVTTTGASLCWGYNSNGQLGDGSVLARSVPSPVSGPQQFTRVDVGSFHGCGLTEALELYCWGLAYGVGPYDFPPRVPTLVLGGLPFTAFDLGVTFTCGRVASGRGYCWGTNSSGQLGDGTFVARESPVPIAGH